MKNYFEDCRLVTLNITKKSDKFYAAPCLPTIRGFLVEHQNKEEYLKELWDYEVSEANCNTCKHLQRIPHSKQPDGFLFGKCCLDEHNLKFHPEDPLHMECYDPRRIVKGRND